MNTPPIPQQWADLRTLRDFLRLSQAEKRRILSSIPHAREQLAKLAGRSSLTIPEAGGAEYLIATQSDTDRLWRECDYLTAQLNDLVSVLKQQPNLSVWELEAVGALMSAMGLRIEKVKRGPIR